MDTFSERADWPGCRSRALSRNHGPGDHAVRLLGVSGECGNYINLRFFDGNGFQLGSWERHANEGYVPTQAMYLYFGIWDCSDRDPNHQFCVADPGSFTGDSSCAFQWVYYNTQSLT